ncbi:transcription factor 7-like [Antennarius striatus]|uniref:transcription factor 7-like n=1 Tax=Antennarius striatus TaxID=241820 RepID=UPI0035B19ED7
MRPVADPSPVLYNPIKHESESPTPQNQWGEEVPVTEALKVLFDLMDEPLPTPPPAPPVDLMEQEFAENHMTPLSAVCPPASPDQHLQDEWGEEDILVPLMFTNPLDSPPQTVQDPPVVRTPEWREQPTPSPGLQDEEPVYTPPPPVDPPTKAASPPARTSKRGSKRTRSNRHAAGRQSYVKKPPNAFMLFLRDKRQEVDVSIRLQGSGAVNAALGQQWRSMSMSQQNKYYAQAEKLNNLHMEQHPGWSAKQNYGKNRKRVRR